MFIFFSQTRRTLSSFSHAAVCAFYAVRYRSHRVSESKLPKTVSERFSWILPEVWLQPERQTAALQVTQRGINVGYASCTFYIHIQFQTTLIVIYVVTFDKLLQTLTSCFKYLLFLVWRLAVNWRMSEDMPTFIEPRGSGAISRVGDNTYKFDDCRPMTLNCSKIINS